MPAPNKMDVQTYVRAPILSAWKAVVLGLRLILAAPADLSERSRAALEAVRAAIIAVQAIARQRQRASPESLKKYDTPLDSGWVGLRMSLEAVARLVDTPEAERATKLLARVFPAGTGFVQLAYEQQWTESENLLTRIDEDGLEAEIVALVGPLFLPFIRAAHLAFGEALGLVSAPREMAETNALGEAVSEASFAISEYGRIMAGELDRADPASVERFKKAMAPLDAFRATHARGAPQGGDVEPPVEPETDVDPEAPIPPIPGGPTEG